MFLINLGNFLAYFFIYFFFILFSLSPTSGTAITRMLTILFHSTQGFVHLSAIFFPLFSSPCASDFDCILVNVNDLL